MSLRRSFSSKVLLVGLFLSAGVFPRVEQEAGAAADPLTPEERAFVAAHGPIRYAPDPLFPPLEFLDPSGDARGITPDLLTLMGKKLGVEFRTVAYPTWSDVLEAVRQGEVDLLGTLTRTPEREGFLLFSKPYLSVPYVLFVRQDGVEPDTIDDMVSRRLGVVRNYGINPWLSAEHPKIHPVAVEDTAMGLTMVATGQLDALLETLPVGAYIVRDKSLSNIRIVPRPIYTLPQHFGVHKGEPLLLSIVQKGLDSLTETERTGAFVRWTGQDFSRPLPAISPNLRNALLILVAAAVLSVVWIAVLRHKVRSATQLLRESEEKFRTVADITYDWEYWVAPDRSMRYVSPSCECITGYPAEAFTGDPGLLHRIVYPEDRPWFDAHICDHLEGAKRDEAHDENEFRIVRKDGELRWVGHVCKPVFGADGSFQGMRGSNRDVSERKRAEEEKVRLQSQLQQTTKQLGLAMNAAELGVWEWDVPSDLFTIGEHFSRALGYTPDEFGHHLKNWLKIVHPEDLPKGMERLIAHLKGETPLLEVEHRSRTKSGEWKWFQIRGKVIERDPDGKALRLSGISVNITEKKIAEDTLRKSEKQHRFVLDNLKVVVFRSDAEGRWIFLNPAWTELTGFNVLESLGNIYLDYVFPDDRQLNSELVRQLIGQEKDYCRHEVRYLRKDGGIRWVEAWARLTFDEQDNTMGIAGTLTDITDRKRAEEEKKKLLEQLQHAMKMEAVGRLAGGVAHDFNNLLTVILGNVSMALGNVPQSAPVAGMLSEVNKAAERAARLTQQLLAFSRKQIIEPKVLDLNLLIHDLRSMLIRLIGEHIELGTVPGADLGRVKVDAGQFEQIMVNLAVNARDAMPDGGKLLIETANVDLDDAYCARHSYTRPGRYVLLAVTDTGQGMSEEVKKQIFEPFFTTKPKGTGTGLGLATIYGAVKQSGGSIEVYSKVGKGTTFRIYLPRVEGEVVGPKESDLPQELLEGSETVLLVEDEENVRNLCVRILERLGYRVLQASGGEEAIALAQGCGDRIDLLMTDVVMPGMHGRELASRLTRIHPETRVLFTSGYTDNAIVHHGVLDEGVSFIGKPYTPWALAKKIREVLDKA